MTSAVKTQIWNLSVLIAATFCVVLSAHAGGGKTESGTATDGVVKRGYTLYTPSNAQPGAPMVVMLHGCLETVNDIAQGTRMNDWAEKYGFYVLYPEQDYTSNALKCWNFFTPENQARTEGEAELITKLALKFAQDKSIDMNRIYLAGLSAGSAMAANLLACYSDIYSGALLHSGLEYAVAQDQTAAQDAMAHGPRTPIRDAIQNAYSCSLGHPKLLRVVVVHGSADNTVNPVNGRRTLEQFLGVDQMIAPSAVVTQASSRIDQQSPGESADVTDYYFDGQPTLKSVVVQKMGHAWSGGSSAIQYMDPNGVDATQIGIEYLLGVSLP